MAATTRRLIQSSFRVLQPTESLLRGRLRTSIAFFSNERPDGQEFTEKSSNQDSSVSSDRFVGNLEDDVD